MVLSYLGFGLLLYAIFRLVRFAFDFALDVVYNAEVQMVGRRLLVPIDDPRVNRIVSDALAGLAPGRAYLLSGMCAGMAAVLAVPIVHFLYAVWVRLLMGIGDPWDYSGEVFLTSMAQIRGYMPRIAINCVALALVGAYYAIKRRRYLQENRLSRLLFWQVPTVEIFGTVYGWCLYFIAAVLPRVSGTGGWFNFSGMLTLSGGWVWLLSGVLISMYFQSVQDALLWGLYRYRWSHAIPAVVTMMVMRRLGMPRTAVERVEVDEPKGAADIVVHIDPIDAQRLRDSLLAVSGLRHPSIVALGAPPGYTPISPRLAPRMRPLPPRSFRRPGGPPKGYGAERNLLDPAEEPTGTSPVGAPEQKRDA